MTSRPENREQLGQALHMRGVKTREESANPWLDYELAKRIIRDLATGQDGTTDWQYVDRATRWAVAYIGV